MMRFEFYGKICDFLGGYCKLILTDFSRKKNLVKIDGFFGKSKKCDFTRKIYGFFWKFTCCKGAQEYIVGIGLTALMIFTLIDWILFSLSLASARRIN